MGKNGKERKRRKLENALISSFDNKSECSDEDENASDPTTGMKQSELENCTTCLNFVGKNLDIYHSATYKMLRKILFPLIEEQKLKYFEKTFDNECEDHIDALSFDLTAATKTFSKLSQDIPLFLSPELKALRKALYPLFMDSRESAGLKCSVTLSGQVSLALSSKQWTEAYRYLVDMRRNQIIPKLGALQRWVRQVDDVPDRPLAILLLRAILDVTKPAAAFSALVCDGNTKRGRDECSTLLSGLSDGKEAVKIQHLKPFCFSLSAATATAQTEASSSELAAPLASDFPVVFCIAGKDRRPQSEEDMNIYTSRLGAFRGFSAAAEDEATNAVRTDIPNVPGAFLLSNVLTAAECNQLMRAAEMLGYSRDAVEGIDAQVWLAQQDVVDAIYSRCRALLPQKNALGHPLVGINKRFRFFRYGAGAVYRPHIDGSWTGGGIDPVTLEYKDNLHVSHHSYMTFLIYLNGDFTGGGTTFFVPDVTASAESTAAAETTADLLAGATQQDPCGSSGSSGSVSACAIYAQSVVPAQGSILCFPHGTVEGSLIHEGSAVLEGVKYVIRSDVMYDLQG